MNILDLFYITLTDWKQEHLNLARGIKKEKEELDKEKQRMKGNRSHHQRAETMTNTINP